MIAALYVEDPGCYVGLDGVDPWPQSRDARNYAGPWPVVAHPPCARWCRLAGLVEKTGGRKRGEDGGCFESALAAVRKYGGVLEHPAYSAAWARFGLQLPLRGGGWTSSFGEFSCEVEQGNYGHLAPKKTWLFVSGVSADKLPGLIWGRSGATMVVATSRKGHPRNGIPKRIRHLTPLPFRDLLISIAESCRK